MGGAGLRPSPRAASDPLNVPIPHHVVVLLVHHTDCGMLTFRDDEVRAAIETDTGIRPPFALEAFTDVEATSARRSLASRQAPSFHTRTRCAASSTTFSMAACRKLALPLGLAPDERVHIAFARRGSEYCDKLAACRPMACMRGNQLW